MRWALVLLWMAAPAAAQMAPGVEEGRAALAEADFLRAVRAFDAAERGELDRASYLALLEGRAIAAWALGEVDAARNDLAALAAVDPERTFPDEAPPDLMEVFDDLIVARDGPLRARALWSPGGDSIRVEVQSDDRGLVARVRVHVRSRGGEWSSEERAPGEIFAVTATGGREAWVELVGPGGAVLATVASSSAPLVWEPQTQVATAEDPTALWIGLGVGLGVAAIVAIAIVIVFAMPAPSGAQPSAPIVIGF